MILEAFTIFHVLISLVGIGSGCIVVFGLLGARRLDGWTATFLISTLATSLTGFLFPVHKLLPSHVLGILSVVVLAFAFLARYKFRMVGAWRVVYVLTAGFAFYLNAFVLVVQLFKHVPALVKLAPTQTEHPFQLAQLAVLVLFLVLGVLALRQFRVREGI